MDVFQEYELDDNPESTAPPTPAANDKLNF